MKIKVKIDGNTDIIDFKSYYEIWDEEKWQHLIDEEEYGEDWYRDWIASLKSIAIDGREIDLNELNPYTIYCEIYREKLVNLAKEILTHDTGEGVCYSGFLPDPAYSKQLKEFLSDLDCETNAFKGFDIEKACKMREFALIERDCILKTNTERVWKQICNGKNTIIEFEMDDR